MPTWMFNDIALLTTVLAGWVLFHKKIRTSPTWHATVTPLASIIGSGFLVSAPLLVLSTGKWSLLVMIAIVSVAYAIGASFRFNIRYVEPLYKRHHLRTSTRWIRQIETLSRPVLGVAYFISVAFYLKLLSAFTLRGIGLVNPIYENSLTTIILLFIGIMGKLRGLHMLELLETYSVNTKLSIICALLVTLCFYNFDLFSKGAWILKAYSHEPFWISFRKVLGLLIIVQGFETSRYLGQAYSAEKRIQTMRYAQWISGSIYILFVALAMIVFNDIDNITETTIIDLSRIVAPILAILLVIAAIMSQFSAAVADTVGGGGLLAETCHQKITVNTSYIIISFTAIILTWLTNIYQIIVIASKAFAIYYALQIVLTLIRIRQIKAIKHRLVIIIFYGLLLSLMILVVIFGIPAE